ncbi:MAG: methylmalonyl-CoA mutase family protein [Chloroflexota bacterium]|jgi:methylmalonyl-CoA mutase N-terminal domain/subunit|tara:strand:- start:15932 stop:17575 length:1644 start_codon:yes stop_codon:yes gene_type:complete
MESSSKSNWIKNVLQPAIKRRLERKSEFNNRSGVEIHALYDQDDSDPSDLGYPGEYPYTRGLQPNMYRGKVWTMRQYAGLASAEESNARYKFLLDSGQSGLSVAFDLPTQTGYDSDHPLAVGEVGRAGVPISSLADMEILFREIPLDKVTTSMTINSTASIILAMYIALAKREGVSLDQIGGTVQNDILKEYIARGTYIFPPLPSMRLVTDLFQYCAEHIPKWNTISISGYHMREAGATAVQELAFTFSNAIEYVQAAINSGLDVDSFAPRLSFFFVAQSDLFEEVSKFRAARRMWANIMRNRFNAKNPRSWMCRFHTQTAGVTLTAQQPDNNVVRSALQGLSAVLGGTQSLHVNSRDEALSLPTPESAELSLRTQQILAHETSITDTVDPLGGSYYIEHLTGQIENEANTYIDQIQNLGGALGALQQGFQIKEIHDSAYKLQQDIESNERIVVGVNSFQTEDPTLIPIQRIDPNQTRIQLERLAKVKSERDSSAVKQSLETLKVAASGDQNMMPIMIDAVENYVTVGEISDALREVFGEQKEFSPF